jgi:hypothetical protein
LPTDAELSVFCTPCTLCTLSAASLSTSRRCNLQRPSSVGVKK